MTSARDRGRDALDRQAWASAYRHLREADGKTPLNPDDLEGLAVATYLTGRHEQSVGVWERAHDAHLTDGDTSGAVRCAIWVAFALINRGELARGGGWVARARRLLGDSDGDEDSAQRGYVCYLAALRTAFEGDIAGGHAGFVEAAATGERLGDPELAALARVGVARCLMYLGDIATGLAMLDEVMVAIGAQEVSPTAVGDLYCTAIDGCHELFDVRRIQEWTAAFDRWCATQPELVLYRGQCLLHRAELMLLHGEWPEAEVETGRALDRLARPVGHPAQGAAQYLRAELHRLRGKTVAAARDYRRANEHGHRPHPGLALLRLAQGHVDDAAAAIRRALAEATEPVARAPLLGASVEILIAAGDLDAAQAAADELAALAQQWSSPLLRAESNRGAGAVLLAADRPGEALAQLRRAADGWRELDAPYELARVGVLIASACRRLGDEDGAEMELATACATFARLGANLAAAGDLAPTRRRGSGGLSARELEVLSLVATGQTNRAIAAALIISERTVDSHVSSIFTKLGLSSRAAATAYAYEHDLV